MPANAGDTRDVVLISGLGRSSGEGNTPVFLPGESHGERSLEGYSPLGCKEMDTTEGTSHVSLGWTQVREPPNLSSLPHSNREGWVWGQGGAWSEWKWKSISSVQLFATPRTIQSMEFSKPEYWSGEPFPFPGDLPHPGIEPRSPAFRWIVYQLSFRGPWRGGTNPRRSAVADGPPSPSPHAWLWARNLPVSQDAPAELRPLWPWHRLYEGRLSRVYTTGPVNSQLNGG